MVIVTKYLYFILIHVVFVDFYIFLCYIIAMELMDLAVAERATREDNVSAKDVKNWFGYGTDVCEQCLKRLQKFGIIGEDGSPLLSNANFKKLYDVHFTVISSEQECEDYKSSESPRAVTYDFENVYFSIPIDFYTLHPSKRVTVNCWDVVKSYGLKASKLVAINISNTNWLEANDIVCITVQCFEKIVCNKIKADYIRAEKLYAVTIHCPEVQVRKIYMKKAP